MMKYRNGIRILVTITTNALKCRTLGVYNVRARMLESTRAIESQLTLYTARSAIALTRAVCMLLLPHAVTNGASLHIEQKNLIAGKAK